MDQILNLMTTLTIVHSCGFSGTRQVLVGVVLLKAYAGRSTMLQPADDRGFRPVSSDLLAGHRGICQIVFGTAKKQHANPQMSTNLISTCDP